MLTRWTSYWDARSCRSERLPVHAAVHEETPEGDYVGLDEHGQPTTDPAATTTDPTLAPVQEESDSTTLSSATYSFTAADKTKPVYIKGAGASGALYTGTITNVTNAARRASWVR